MADTKPSLNVLDGFQRALPQALGEDLLALYLEEGTDVSQSRLWLLVAPDLPVLQLREVFLPLWQAHPGAFQRGPAVATLDDFVLYRLLFPDRAAFLQDAGQLLAGEPVWSRLPTPSPPNPIRSLARLAADAMDCSAWLAVPESREALEAQLIRLARQVSDQEAGGAGMLDHLGALYAHLAEQERRYPAYQWEGEPPAELPPPNLPGLIALIGRAYRLIVVMPQVDLDLLSKTDWALVADLVSNEFNEIVLATPWQLRLAASVEWAVELFTRSFDLVWGSDVLAACCPLDSDLVLGSAVHPVRVLVEQFPADYLTVEEEALGDLIHDVQNKLLGIQLRNEVLSRLQKLPSEQAPEKLPGREAPPHDRIAATFRQFRWWSRYLSAPLVS